MRILGIETSCDETAVAVVEDGKKLLANVVASSADMHVKYGGIVPEVAARKQVESIIPVLTETLTQYSNNQQFNNMTLKQFFDSIDAIAVTVGPGLVGSLLVGVETAKTLAFTWNKPIILVNHVLAHIYAVFLEEKQNPQLTTYNLQLEYPAIALVVSGLHTELFYMKDIQSFKWLGGTLDDAAGEAFDKTARLLGFPYPGGPAIATAAANYELRTKNYELKLPRPMLHDDSLNFSFSGLKTAVLREWKKLSTSQQHSNVNTQQFSYAIQEAITDVLVAKTVKAANKYNAKSIIITGGVAANKRLREKFAVHSSQFVVAVPKVQHCVDSGSFIAAYAYFHNHPVPWQKITAVPALNVEI